jgi:hypothetical protein
VASSRATKFENVIKFDSLLGVADNIMLATRLDRLELIAEMNEM